MSPGNGSWAPAAGLEALRLRARLLALIRGFFEQREVLEVETPVLSAGGNTDPNIESFITGFSGHAQQGATQRWLRTSPEHALKRMLAAGVGDCYELGRVFRNGEAGRRHNPEFSMLEWYRVGWDHQRLIGEVAELVDLTMQSVSRPLQVRRIEYRVLYRDHFGFDPFTAPLYNLQHALGDIVIDPSGLGRDDWLDLLMTHRLQPGFSPDQLLFVFDFPASQCALARVRGDGADAVAERFETYLGEHEIANGYHELCDAAEQERRFAANLSDRAARGLLQPACDRQLLRALEHGLPDCAGVALGVDRLLMAMSDRDDIRDVIAFPFERA